MARSKKENPSPSETDGTSRRHNRRQALGLAGVAAAAAAVAAVGMNGGKEAQAVTGDNMKVGQFNEATPGDGTELAADVDGASALNVTNPATPGGTAIHGDGPNGATGLRGTSTSGPGVHATSEDEPAVLGVSGSPRFLAEGDPGFSLGAGPGVEGHSGTGAGVKGQSQSGPGVEGRSQGAEGVRGFTHAVPSGFGPWHGVYGASLKPGVGTPSGPDDLGDGFGVFGTTGGGVGVNGMSVRGPGVSGSSEHTEGVSGGTYGTPSPENFPVGVAGFSLIRLDEDPAGPVEDGPGTGVLGRSGSGTGVHGMSESNIGVLGVSESDRGMAGWSRTGTGVWAGTESGEALRVDGKAFFSTAGAGAVPTGADAATVSNPAVTPDSHITVTLMGHPGNSAAVVQWVERQGSGFIVHLRVAVSNETPFTYLIVEPGA